MNINLKTPLIDQSLAQLEKLTQKTITFGNLLWSIRNCEEVNQTEFAKMLGISRQYLCDLERGRRTVSAKMAADFAERLNHLPEQFIRIALQDELAKSGLHYNVQLSELKNAA